MQLSIKRLTSTAQAPTKGHTSDLGWDLYADENVQVAPGKLARIRTGVAIGFPEKVGGLIKDRSSLAAAGMHTIAGVIDPDYRGEILVLVVNLGEQLMDIQQGDRFAQMVLLQTIAAEAVEIDALDDTQRGAGGFGSTGS